MICFAIYIIYYQDKYKHSVMRQSRHIIDTQCSYISPVLLEVVDDNFTLYNIFSQ